MRQIAPGNTDLLLGGCWASKTLHMKFVLLGKSGLLAIELLLSMLLTVSMLSFRTSRTQGKATDEPCQDRVGQPLKISCF